MAKNLLERHRLIIELLLKHKNSFIPNGLDSKNITKLWNIEHPEDMLVNDVISKCVYYMSKVVNLLDRTITSTGNYYKVSKEGLAALAADGYMVDQSITSDSDDAEMFQKSVSGTSPDDRDPAGCDSATVADASDGIDNFVAEFASVSCAEDEAVDIDLNDDTVRRKIFDNNLGQEAVNVHFDLSDQFDQFLFGLVTMFRDIVDDIPSIQNKRKKLIVLSHLANNTIIHDDVRALLLEVYADVEKLKELENV